MVLRIAAAQARCPSEVFQNDITAPCVAGFVEQRAKTALFHSRSQLLLRNVRFKSCQAGGKCVLLATVQQMVRNLKGNKSTKVDALHRITEV